MSWFGDLPIRRKLLLMTLASSATALVLATSGFLAWDVVQLRSEIRQDVDAQATIVAQNSAAPLTFMDNRAAGETLAVLRLRPQVAVACLYSVNGQLFATYHRDPTKTCPPEPPSSAGFEANAYNVVTAVTMKNDRLGTLYVNRELTDLYARLRVGLATVAGLLIVAFLGALLIAGRLQQSIASPLLQLAQTARAISIDRDYSMRATSNTNDEIGIVVHAFNDMLERLARRNADLSQVNIDLAREVEERRRAEVERTAALERERDANRLKDEFLATLSHELRTPLNAVLGWARVLRTTQIEPPQQARALESIERNAQAQAKLIEDLLDVSRIVTGKLRIQMQNVDLAAIIDAAIEVVQPAASAKRIRVITEISARPAMIAGDPNRLQQIAWNLLSNAVKFTPEEGEVRIRLERSNGIRLTIGDSGAGIDPRFLPHVFEPFRQADGTASREHGGLGLGLAIAKQLVELHGGTIGAQSDGRGRGATFEVHLPAAVAHAAVPPPAPLQDVPPALALDHRLLQHLRVLVVDDQEDARDLLETMLAQFGARVEKADSTSAALASIQREPPDVILSDIGMPHEDGYALIRRLRSLSPAHGGDTPAVAITAYASTRDRGEALAAGYQAHVAKPFDAIQVAVLVAQLGRGAVGTRK